MEYSSEIRECVQSVFDFERSVSLDFGFHYDRIAENVAVKRNHAGRHASVKTFCNSEHNSELSDCVDIFFGNIRLIFYDIAHIEIVVRVNGGNERSHDRFSRTETVNTCVHNDISRVFFGAV